MLKARTLLVRQGGEEMDIMSVNLSFFLQY